MALTLISTTDSEEEVRKTAEKLGDVVEEDKAGKPAEDGAKKPEKKDETATSPEKEKEPDAKGESSAPPDKKAAAKEPGEKGATHKEKDEDDDSKLPEWMQKRVARIKRSRETQRERADKLEREMEELKAAQAKPNGDKPKDAEQSESATEKPKPNRDQFESDEDYEEAVADWRAEKKLAEHLAKVNRDAFEVSERERQAAEDKSFNEGVVECEELFEDWEEVMEEGKSLKMTRAAHEAVGQLAKDGPYVSYQLVKRPELVAEINKCATLGQVYLAVGRIAARLEAERQAEPKKTAAREATREEPPPPPAPKKPTKQVVSQAPPPIADLESESTETADGRPREDDPNYYAKYKVWRKRQGL